MADVSDDAYRLHIQAERWQALVARQQQVAFQLRNLVSEQRELAELWDAAGADDLVDEANEVAEGIRNLSTRIIRLEQLAVDMIVGVINEAFPDPGGDEQSGSDA